MEDNNTRHKEVNANLGHQLTTTYLSNTDWISDYQRWLSEEESLNNAQRVIYHFAGSDWTPESLSAMCGNMRHESSINPDMYEYGYDWSEDRGYGLVQWTPRSKYWDWALLNALPPRHGDSQLARIDYEIDNNIQWIANRLSISPPYPAGLSSYGGSFSDFRQNVDALSLNELTEAFMWNYEGPSYEAAIASLSVRQAFALRVRSELDFEGTTPTPTPETLHYIRRHSTNMRRMGVRGRR